jgi:uncharacterized protein YfeS
MKEEKIYISRKNKVILKKVDDQYMVFKHYSSHEECNTEYQRYQDISQKGIKVPHVLRMHDTYMAFSWIDGITALEYMEQNEQSDIFDALMWDEFAKWIIDFLTKMGYLMEDVNLRNYIFQPQSRKVYGIDFEGNIIQSKEAGIAGLLAYIKLYAPENSKWRGFLVDYLRGIFVKELRLSEALLSEEEGKAVGEIRQRRITKKTENRPVFLHTT